MHHIYTHTPTHTPTHTHTCTHTPGSTYNIPITVWLRPNHPVNGPLVYVSPTEDMGIQQSRFVDSNGLVYLPYISEWRQVSSLVEL